MKIHIACRVCQKIKHNVISCQDCAKLVCLECMEIHIWNAHSKALKLRCQHIDRGDGKLTICYFCDTIEILVRMVCVGVIQKTILFERYRRISI
jgi:hypothetical protein